jgi:hypothetical protein
LLPAAAVPDLKRVREHNPLLFDLAIKRLLSWKGHSFSASVFQTLVFRRKRSVELPRKRPLFRCESGHHSGEKGQCQESVSGLVFLYCHSFGFLVKH